MSSLPLRLDIQGLRALAVLAVIVFHINKEWLPSGFIGVDIFFVISGYIISTIILNRKSDFSILDFYNKRILRIVPPYIFLLSITCLVSTILFTNNDLIDFYQSIKTALLFYSNYYFSDFGNYFSPSSDELPLLHTWSLSVEMQFYFILPFLLLAFSEKINKKIIIFTIILITIWCELYNKNHSDIYFSLTARIPEFLIGTFAAIIYRKNYNLRYLSHFGIFLLIPCLFLIPESKFPGFLSILPCLATALILLQKQENIINQYFSKKIIVYIGTISYSLYLWHWPILAFFRYYSEQKNLDLKYIILSVILTAILSILSYHLIEKSISKNKKSRVYSFILFNFIFILLLLTYGKDINKKITPDNPLSLSRYADAKMICHSQILPSCLVMTSPKEKNVLVIGDSHAGQLNLYFKHLSKSTDYNFNVISSSSCLPIEKFNINNLPEWAVEPCKRQIKIIQKELPKYDTVIISALWSKHLEDKDFSSVLSDFINKTKNTHNILIMAQIPTFSRNVKRVQHFKSLGLNPEIHVEEYQSTANQEIQALSKKSNITFLDFSKNHMFAAAPFYKDIPIYFDSNHLNESGVELYVQNTGKELISTLNKF
ncbi:acyltransferase [Acinetobacter chinensis]|uniref:Acyltransferase n=1 Tax=Acinetobacter chinensis TaxID=2004650 RepID=A0A3B7M6W3_9GAMM|nr:acyltransferase family protein [Acinetobacter chinensis]AXY58149.1 acyltransferase [Acinetobacter chinensis]